MSSSIAASLDGCGFDSDGPGGCEGGDAGDALRKEANVFVAFEAPEETAGVAEGAPNPPKRPVPIAGLDSDDDGVAAKTGAAAGAAKENAPDDDALPVVAAPDAPKPAKPAKALFVGACTREKRESEESLATGIAEAVYQKRADVRRM